MKPIAVLIGGAAFLLPLLDRAAKKATSKEITSWPYATRELATGCDPGPKPGVKLFAKDVMNRFGGSDLGISRECSFGGPSEHHEGRAWDWGISGANIDGMFSWLFASGPSGPHEALRRLGIMYIIYNRKIWRAYGAHTWEPYDGSNPHTDHVHFSFSRAGAMGQVA